MIKNIRNKNSTDGFTLIEVMIAILIFGFLLLYASQFMRSEIHVFETASGQNEVDQKARVAMMHILDEIRLNNLTFYKSTSTSQGIYRYAGVAEATATPKNEIGSICLIFINLQPSSTIQSSSAKVFFDKAKGQLWYQNKGSKYLIADEISKLSIEEDSSLAKIDIIVGGNNGSQPYEILTWVRLN